MALVRLPMLAAVKKGTMMGFTNLPAGRLPARWPWKRYKEPRAAEQVREHYLIEKELAQRLGTATKEQRALLYASLYDELFRRVPHHSLLVRKANPEARKKAVAAQMKLLRPFLQPSHTFLEIGPGDCALAFEVAASVAKVLAVDVSREIIQNTRVPENCKVIVSDGCSVPVPACSVDLAYSNQLIEHLHPEDALEHLKNVHAALKRGGVYLCITPNRLFGPHDVSKYFDRVASGFHLKEYTIAELSSVFEAVGFSKSRALIGGGSFFVRVPLLLLKWAEHVLGRLPRWLILRLSYLPPLKAIRAIRLVAEKPC